MKTASMLSIIVLGKINVLLGDETPLNILRRGKLA